MNISIELLLFLIGAHFIADFPLQGDFLANTKAKYSYLLFAHCFIWAICISLVLKQYGVFEVWQFFLLIVGHFIIDKIKCMKKDKSTALTVDLWIDQFLHLIQILFIFILVF